MICIDSAGIKNCIGLSRIYSFRALWSLMKVTSEGRDACRRAPLKNVISSSSVTNENGEEICVQMRPKGPRCDKE